jgi:hypothetical protein
MRALKTLRIAPPALLALTTALACAGPAFGDAHVRQASAHGSYRPQQSWPSRSAPDGRLHATVLGRRLDGDVVDRRTRPPIRTRAGEAARPADRTRCAGARRPHGLEGFRRTDLRRYMGVT